MAKACRTTERGIRIWSINGLFGHDNRDETDARVFDDADLKRGMIISAAVMAGMRHAEIRGASNFKLHSEICSASGFLQQALARIPRGYDL